MSSQPVARVAVESSEGHPFDTLCRLGRRVAMLVVAGIVWGAWLGVAAAEFPLEHIPPTCSGIRKA